MADVGETTFIKIFDHILERLEGALPQPVARAPSVRKACLVAGTLAILGAAGALSTPSSYRIPMAAGVLLLAAVAYKELQEYFYMRDVYIENAQHFVNIRWIPRYLAALQGR